MNWDSNYELGIAEIDAQHQFLFERIRMIESAVAIGGGADFVRSVIADLEHYSEVHFAAEEALFARYHYPDSEAHRLEHQRFIAAIAQIKKGLNSDVARVGDELLGYLREWFSRHILGSDFAYGDFLKNR